MGKEGGKEGGREGGREGEREGGRERWIEQLAQAILFLSILIESYARVGHFLCISPRCPNKISIKQDTPMARSNSYKHMTKMADQYKYSISYSVSLCFPDVQSFNCDKLHLVRGTL